MKREDLRKVEVKICKENKKGFLETNIEEGYFHTWTNKDAIVELKDGTIEVVPYRDIRFKNQVEEETEEQEGDKITYRSYLLYTLEINLEKAIQNNRAAILVKDDEEVEYDDLLVKDDGVVLCQQEKEVANIDLNKIYYVRWLGNKVRLME